MKGGLFFWNYFYHILFYYSFILFSWIYKSCLNLHIVDSYRIYIFQQNLNKILSLKGNFNIFHIYYMTTDFSIYK